MKNNRHDEVCPDKCELSDNEVILALALDNHFTFDNCCGRLILVSSHIECERTAMIYKCQKCLRRIKVYLPL